MTRAVKGTPRRRAEQEVAVSTALSEQAPAPTPEPAAPVPAPAPAHPDPSGEAPSRADAAAVEVDGTVYRRSETATVASPQTYSRGELRDIIGVPKLKSQVPTLVRFPDRETGALRTVIVDIGEPILSAGWDYYRRTVPNAEPSDYLEEVRAVTRSDVPRLYKVVAELRLGI